MLGRPLRERVAMRATMDRRKTSSTAGSSTFISHLAEHVVIPGDRLERDHLEPRAGRWRFPWSRSLLDRATDVDSSQVEVVDPLINEQDDLLAGAWLAIGIKRDSGQVA